MLEAYVNTPDQMREMYETYKSFDEYMREFIITFAEDIENIHDHSGDVYEISIEEGRVEGTIYRPAHCSCCNDDVYISFPVEYLWTPNWIELERERRWNDQMERLKKQEEETKYQEAEALDQRKAQYLKLKQEFEPVD